MQAPNRGDILVIMVCIAFTFCVKECGFRWPLIYNGNSTREAGSLQEEAVSPKTVSYW